MSLSLTEADREALGLETATFGVEQFVGVLPDVAGYGRAPLATAATLAALVAGGHFSTPRVDAADRIGMRISVCDEQPAVVRVVEESGAVLEARGAGQLGEWMQPDAVDPATVFVDLSRAKFVSVRKRDGSGLLLRCGTDGFFVTDFRAAAGATDLVATVRAPIASWLRGCDDPWLAGELRRRAGLEDGWQQTVAAGICARLTAPPAAPARYVERLLARETPRREAPPQPRRRDLVVNEEFDRDFFALEDSSVADRVGRATFQMHFTLRRPAPPPREWARALSPEQAKTLADVALAVADRLGETLDDLYERMAPGEEWWLSSFHTACVERDDLEAVRLILTEQGGAARLAMRLDQLDRAGRRLTASIPQVIVLTDERLYRAHLADPYAWWASLAAPEQEA